MGDSGGWAQLQQEADSDAPARKPARRRALTAVVILVVAVLVVVGGAFLAEYITRGVAEDAVAVAVESNLPSNVDATVDVDIAGDWVLLQLISGRMDEVTITSDDVTFDGTPVENMAVTASGVPIDLKVPVENIAATVSLDQSTLNQVLTLPGNDPEVSLAEGSVVYEDSTEVIGIPIGYAVTAALSPDGTDVLVTPQSAEVTTEMGSIDLSGIVDRLVGAEPVRVCLADKLPVGVSISAIDVRDGTAHLSLAASDFILSGSSFRTTGECPA
ncbi:DUF2993 domain-containing protein [Mycetocola sp. 2940]|uniref:LmeA family phospholipid-binding protein n=1 Tax=Mycetocola sp. 2940 TaxID=3156452 RepID=UPI003399F837